MHQHMPGYDLNEPEGPNSYRQRMENLNNNPAIAAYYFQMCWELFFEKVLWPKFNITDWWWRYEWQHRGSSHVHGFFWFSDAPKVDDLNLGRQDHVDEFVRYWDQHISTWNPDRN